MPRTLAVVALFFAITPATLAQTREPILTLEGQSFYSWQEYTSSPLFQERGLRCAAPGVEGLLEVGASDCSLGSTTLDSSYDPTSLYEIPVVVHVLQHSSGQGQISDALVQSQIAILNQDFLAVSGSNGQNGANSGIRFYLAQVDPQGNPTSGITRSVNDAWFLDIGNYWDTLAWDPNRYLNIYTNLAGGALGYVPGFPAGGVAGTSADRVVVLWSSFGLNAPIGPPFNKGRTTTHEVGHYLGLFHTFQGSCGGAACFSSGDRICDTNPEFSPTSGCPGSRNTCGQPAPIDNYMDYSDDLCMERFTPQQINRMRCTLEHWRMALPCFQARVGHRNAGPNLDIYTSSTPGLGLTLNATVDDNGATNFDTVVFLGALAPANRPLGNGQVALVDTDVPLPLIAPLPKAGATVLSLNIPTSPALCGLVLYTQALLTGGEPGFVLTNAQDWLIGG